MNIVENKQLKSIDYTGLFILIPAIARFLSFEICQK